MTPADEQKPPADAVPVERRVRPHVVTETDEWKLGCFFDWRPKPMAIACPYCYGKGEVGGGFKDLDGPQPCPECWGTKIKSVAPTTQPPEIPPELREHMRRAWWDFFHGA